MIKYKQVLKKKMTTTSSTKNNSHIKTGDDMSVVPYIYLWQQLGVILHFKRRNKRKLKTKAI